MTEKRKYEKPSMEVFKLQQQQLLAGSQLDVQLDGQLEDLEDYDLEDDPFNF